VTEQMTDAPETVAVLIPVFNDSGLLPSTLRSLRDQGVPIVAVVVDDGSTPPLACDADSAGVEIVILRHDANRGIERALNTGLDYIRRRGIAYIARLDNGDRCAPGRLASQRDYLDAHHDVYLVGSAVEWRDDNGRVRFVRELPTAHDDIVRTMHHTTALIHPAVMFRTSVIDTVGVYSTAYPAAEDYELFWRIARRHRVANLAETLLVTRFDPQGLSMRRRRQQLRSTLRIQLAYFQPGTWESWFGVTKTLGRFAIPYSWIVAIKAMRSRRSDLVTA
jgi:glycosyltransferase involved in cell wall biosynthesis